MKKLFLYILMCSFTGVFAQDLPFTGTWELVKASSTEIDLYSTMEVNLNQKGKEINLQRTWVAGRETFKDSMCVKINGSGEKVTINSRLFPTNVFMGISAMVGEQTKLSSKYDKKANVLEITEKIPILVSQGKKEMVHTHTLTYNPDNDILTYVITRPTRPSDEPIRYVLKRKGARQAWFMNLPNNWEIDGSLNWQAALISLQGLVNTDSPQLYFVYPEGWDYRFTPDIKKYLIEHQYYTFKEITKPEEAVKKFKDQLSGYVVWDKSVRTSLIVAFTVAGLEKSIVVEESQIPFMESLGLTMKYDLRNRFTGWNDAKIYQWAYDNFWQACSKESIVWMGGESGKIMKPGVADYGIQKKAFFSDLSTKPADTVEYALADKILSDMKPMGMVFGWHSYAKDLERNHVALTSKHALRVDGLHTLPNMSFMSKVPGTPNFKYKNNHSINGRMSLKPEKKVYISCIQTDCLGLGAWNREGRGSIPYTWEVTMNWSWMAPAMLEYFYTQSSPNDYFIGSLGGPGYVYPKAVPADKLPDMIKETRRLMELLDLDVFEIMDYSEGSTVVGNSEITEDIATQFIKGIPGIIGLANGYTPSFSFGKIKGVPVLSFDYYLSETKPESEAIADIKELATLNDARPYYLLFHVREWSDISRVKSIMDKLGPDYEVIPLDVMMKMAADQTTFKERFLKK
ncbi:MAG: GxGYxYP family putative glycoside hydrolase [Bacteroidales bacterium]|nr:GxGYxYP family putative glycoside hydrolase [Bacteroidales bacterium]